MAHDLRGRRFGKLVVIERGGLTKDGYAIWRCRCDCGGEGLAKSRRLLIGKKKSCGKCGYHGTRGKWLGGWDSLTLAEYRTWQNMLGRCYSPTDISFRNYGARGIVVCDRWRESFEAFLSDMGPRPDGRYSIERVDVNGNYEPENCKWIPLREQHRNRRDSVYVEFWGQKVLLRELADEIGMSYSAIASRLKIGWSVEKAVSEPIRKHKQRVNPEPDRVLKDGQG